MTSNDDTKKRIPRLIVHGGAWGIPDEQLESHLLGVKDAVAAVFPLLLSGMSALDAAMMAVSILEDNFTFDAGCGSVLNNRGEIEMDALIMDGKSLKAGSVAAIQNIKNPVFVARKVMDETDHVMIVGNGANDFAEEMGFTKMATDQMICDREKQFLDKVKNDPTYRSYMSFKSTYKPPSSSSSSSSSSSPLLSSCDTVGAVAMDEDGNIACATSTGGTARKIAGRVGDSPIIGSGGYADNLIGGVSTTGWGESIMKVMLAKHVCDLMKYFNYSASEAANKSLDVLTDPRINGYAGVIVIDQFGNYGYHHNTPRMAFAFANPDSSISAFIQSPLMN